MQIHEERNSDAGTIRPQQISITLEGTCTDFHMILEGMKLAASGKAPTKEFSALIGALKRAEA